MYLHLRISVCTRSLKTLNVYARVTIIYIYSYIYMCIRVYKFVKNIKCLKVYFSYCPRASLISRIFYLFIIYLCLCVCLSFSPSLTCTFSRSFFRMSRNIFHSIILDFKYFFHITSQFIYK